MDGVDSCGRIVQCDGEVVLVSKHRFRGSLLGLAAKAYLCEGCMPVNPQGGSTLKSWPSLC